MKLEEEMYVRFKEDSGAEYPIDKIIETDYSATFEYACTRPLVYLEKNDCIYLDELKQIIKGEPSHNIIELIEVGDVLVVDEIKYTVLQNIEHVMNALHIKTIDNHYSTIKYLFEQNKVESIVTKEQFENISYKVN